MGRSGFNSNWTVVTEHVMCTVRGVPDVTRQSVAKGFSLCSSVVRWGSGRSAQLDTWWSNMVEVLVLNQFCTVTSSPVGNKVRIVVCVLDNLFVLFIKSCFLVARLGDVCFPTLLTLGVCKLQLSVRSLSFIQFTDVTVCMEYSCSWGSYTGLFEMIVGVLTTCHTQYTWDRSICIFFI